MLRSSGIPWDLRLVEAYDDYNTYDFDIPVGEYGDCYDRFVLRLEEMKESLYIMTQCLNKLVVLNSVDDYEYMLKDYKIVPPSRASIKLDMNL